MGSITKDPEPQLGVGVGEGAIDGVGVIVGNAAVAVGVGRIFSAMSRRGVGG